MAPRRYMNYTASQLANAVEMARKGVSIRRAAATLHIPESTVRKNLSTTRLVKSPGRPTILSKLEESRIVEWITEMAKVGVPVDAQRLKTCVASFLHMSARKTPFSNGVPGRKWMKLFLKRHPNISRRIPSALAKHRTNVTEKNIRGWFDEVKVYLSANNLEQVIQSPERVFNMDESSIQLVPTREEVLAQKGEKYIHTRNANSEKESYTTLFAANAAGILAPPLVLFPYKQRLPAEIARNAPPG